MSDETHNKMGDIFMYRPSNGSMICTDNDYINNIRIESVKKILKIICEQIITHDTHKHVWSHEKELLNKIFIVEDMVLAFVEFGLWRHGSGFVCLQISSKNDGNLRASVFTTNTVHHSAMGTTPEANEAAALLDKYLKNGERVIADINKLKAHHSTKIPAHILYANIVT